MLTDANTSFHFDLRLGEVLIWRDSSFDTSPWIVEQTNPNYPPSTYTAFDTLQGALRRAQQSVEQLDESLCEDTPRTMYFLTPDTAEYVMLDSDSSTIEILLRYSAYESE